MVWDWLMRRYTKSVEEDIRQINKILESLNGGTVEGDWESADGFHVMTAVTFDQSGGATFFPDQGMPVKNFVNRKTGEVRAFHFRKVLKK